MISQSTSLSIKSTRLQLRNPTAPMFTVGEDGSSTLSFLCSRNNALTPTLFAPKESKIHIIKLLDTWFRQGMEEPGPLTAGQEVIRAASASPHSLWQMLTPPKSPWSVCLTCQDDALWSQLWTFWKDGEAEALPLTANGAFFVWILYISARRLELGETKGSREKWAAESWAPLVLFRVTWFNCPTDND